MMRLKKQHCLTLAAALLIVLPAPVSLRAADKPSFAEPLLNKRLRQLVGPHDAVMVSAPDGRVLAALNEKKALIPASILKLLTSLAALHYLGADYRFPTDFYLTPGNDLVIKGYGDPLLVSERLNLIGRQLAEKITAVENIVVDGAYFSTPVIIPGRHRSLEPYDAPNGALCVNFNTVFFQRRDRQWVSAEPQTPLLPYLIPRIEASGQPSGRITLAGDAAEGLQYAGELFRFFLLKNGVRINKNIIAGRAAPPRDELLWRYESEDRLTSIIGNLLEYSNNYIANQLMLAMGARANGPPATVDKGVDALQVYYRDVLGIHSGAVVEASGLSRQNRVTAEAMMTILEQFEPFHTLMRRHNGQWYKTGTLKGIQTRAGYLETARGARCRFVVMVNTPGKTIQDIMRTLEKWRPK